MKKQNIWKLLTMMVVAVVCAGFTACGGDDKDEEETQNRAPMEYRYWPNYPQSYIKMCDYRMTFRLTSVKRNSTTVSIDYVLTNTGFDQKIQAVFTLPQTGTAHDDLGNTYDCPTITPERNAVVGVISGQNFFWEGQGKQVDFNPNQAIKGHFDIKNFDQNATAVSLTCNVKLTAPSGLSFMQNRIDFVNIPIDATEGDGTYTNL
ncbi:MAG: hypothetical protein IJ527_02775 [Prevotella sp.]|nr:hypothetical protein [Prevotella sp.]